MTGRPPLTLSFHEWACIRTELLWAYDAAIPKDALRKQVPKESGCRAIYVRQGRIRWETVTGKFEVRPGEWFFIPSESWTQEFSEDAEIISLYFSCEWPSGINLVDHPGFVFEGKKHPELFRIAADLAGAVERRYPMEDRRELGQQVSTFGDFLNQQSLFLQWLQQWFVVMLEKGGEVTALKHSGDERPLRAANILNHAPLEKGFPKDALLKEIGLSEVQVNRLFQQEFGLTLRRYWDGRRFQMARTLMETSTLPVKEISFRLGFLSDSHFVTWFRRQSGKAPAEFRRNGH